MPLSTPALAQSHVLPTIFLPIEDTIVSVQETYQALDLGLGLGVSEGQGHEPVLNWEVTTWREWGLGSLAQGHVKLESIFSKLFHNYLHIHYYSFIVQMSTENAMGLAVLNIKSNDEKDAGSTI